MPMRPLSLFFVLIIFGLSFRALAEDVKLEITALENKLASFEKSPSSEGLAEAWTEASRVPEKPNAENWKDLRRKKFQGVLMVIEAVQAQIDPKFDENDAPTLNVRIPGGGYDAGTKPENIKDPAIRKRYEDAIAQNQKKMQRYNFQLGLRASRDKYIDYLRDFIKRRYNQSEFSALRKEIETVLGNNGVSQIF